jgi:hypothetical protein
VFKEFHAMAELQLVTKIGLRPRLAGFQAHLTRPCTRWPPTAPWPNALKIEAKVRPPRAFFYWGAAGLASLVLAGNRWIVRVPRAKQSLVFRIGLLGQGHEIFF